MKELDGIDALVSIFTSSYAAMSNLIAQLEQTECSKGQKNALLKAKIRLTKSEKDFAKLNKKLAQLRDASCLKNLAGDAYLTSRGTGPRPTE